MLVVVVVRVRANMLVWCVCFEINRTIVYTFCTISESQSGYLTETINYTLQTVGIFACICMCEFMRLLYAFKTIDDKSVFYHKDSSAL